MGVVSALPPGRNSLNEFGFHLVKHLSENSDVSAVYVMADRTDAGPPPAMPKVVTEACWEFNSLGNLFSLARKIRKHRPDGVLFNLQFATFGDKRLAGALGLCAPAVVRLLGVPSIVILHNLADNVDMQDAGFADSKMMAAIMRLAGRILTRVLLRADLVGLTIPRYVEYVRDRYGAENVFLAPHGAFENIDEPSFDIPEGPRRILAFGKWGTYKTVGVLIQAYQQLIERGYKNLELVIAGTDSPNSAGYLAGIAAANREVPGLVFTGYVDEADVAPLFSSSTVVAFPYTSTTGSSGVLHQAGSYGRAVVLPRIGDFLEVIEEEGFCGEYFTPDDAASLADSLATVLDDPARCREIGEQNFAAAAGIPMSEVIDWYLIHLKELVKA